MSPTLQAIALGGLLVTLAVDWVRNGFDKENRIPKIWWNVVAFGFAIILAQLVCHAPESYLAKLHIAAGKGCPDFLLNAGGWAASGTFWHEVLSAFSARSGDPGTPKGFLPKPKV